MTARPLLVTVLSGPFTSGNRCALAFCHAASAAGHRVTVFFYHDGIETARSRPALEGRDPGDAWADWARDADADLIACVAASQRRGLAGDDGSPMPAALRPGFRLAGLGQWLDALLASDRSLRFGVGE